MGALLDHPRENYNPIQLHPRMDNEPLVGTQERTPMKSDDTSRTPRPRTRLQANWSAFWEAIFDPWTIVLLVTTVFLTLLSIAAVKTASNDASNALWYVLITLSASFLGGRATYRWSTASDVDVVMARGQHSVRSLKLLWRSIVTLEQRMRTFRDNETLIRDNPDVTKRNYEEAIIHCRTLEESTLNSIENWIDVVPEANIKSDVGRISELSEQLDAKTQDLAKAEGAKDSLMAQGSTEKAIYEDKIRSLATDVERLKNELRAAKANLQGAMGATGPLTSLKDLLGTGILSAAVTVDPNRPSTLNVNTRGPAGPPASRPDLDNQK
jgi:hypothetical protein